MKAPPVSEFHTPPHPVSEEATKVIDSEVSALMTKGAIEYASGRGFSSQLFVIPKKTGDLRPVLNLRPLNEFLPAQHFKMETIQHVCSVLNRNDYLTSIDLSDAFLHVPIHPDSRRYLQFLWKGRLYQFKVLPFGLSLAPLIFTKVLKPLLRWARRKGIRISAYLDDLIIAAATKEKSRMATEMVLHKLKSLGFLTKLAKSSLTPSQTLQHLGFEIDTTTMTLKVPGQKIRDVRREASKLVNKGTCTVRQLSSFIGKAIAMTAAVFPARLKVQHLLADKIRALKSGSPWESSISLSQAATDELLWWRTNLRQWNGLSWIMYSTKGRLHGRLGLRMGNSSGQQIVQRIMVTSTPVETHQLQGVDDSLYRPSPTRSTRTHNQHNLGQHHDHSIHQPLRRDTVTGSDGAGDIVMGVVSEDRNEDQDDLRSIGIQSCRRTITTTNRATRMVHQQRMLSTIGRNVGTTPRRSLRLTRKPPTLSVYDLEAHNRRHRTRRSSTPLETTGQRLLMPSMESHPSHAAEDQTGEDHCNNSDTSVANSGVVPNDQDDGNCSTNLDTSPPSVAGPGKRPRHTGKEPPLVVMRLEGKRRRLLAKGWDPATASIVVDSPEMKGRQRSYARVQDRYIQWATARGVDAMEPQPAQLLNWLASGVSINNWSSTTVSSYKVAVIQMYEDKTSFDDPDFNLFFKTLRRRQIKHTKELNIDIKPVVDYLLGLGPNEGLSISDLTKKLCWLLGTCGFLRPNDIECIDLSNNKFRVDRVAAILPIMIPKETRGGMRVCRYTTVKGHEDPLLCPVKALSEYLRRIEGHDDTFPHPKDPTVQYRPLIRDVRDMSRPVVTDTISNHIASISGKLALPDGEKLPRARALGSTAAIQQGASVDDVVVHGNWSSSVLFDKFYRLHAATKTNFTSMVLA